MRDKLGDLKPGDKFVFPAAFNQWTVIEVRKPEKNEDSIVAEEITGERGVFNENALVNVTKRT